MDLEVSTKAIQNGWTPTVMIGGCVIWTGKTAFPNVGEAAAAGRSKVRSVLTELFKDAS